MADKFKVLVTGSNGYIGPILNNILLESGHDVIGLDTNFFDKECDLYPVQPTVEVITRDVRNITEDDLKNVGAICHLAGLSNDPLGELNENLTLDINYKASVRLAKMAKKVGVQKFIFASSCSLYGISDTDKPVAEDGELSPLTAYAKSKIQTERDILPLASKDFVVASLRNATAYGVSPRLRLDIVVNNLVGWAHTTNQINIMSDGTPWRPLVHIGDISRAFKAVIESTSDDINGEAFNTGINEENFQIRDVANLIKKVAPSCEINIGNKSPDSRSYRVSFDKIMEYLPNFKPAWNLEKGIQELFDAYKKYNLTADQFNGRYFTRLKQIKYLLDSKKINSNLEWT